MMENDPETTKKQKAPPTLALKIAKVVFGLGIAFSIMAIVYAAYRLHNPIYQENLGSKEIDSFYSFSIVLGIIFAALFSLGFKLKDQFKVNFALIIISTLFPIYLVESLLQFTQPSPSSGTPKFVDGGKIPYDNRTKPEVLRDLNKPGIEAYPNVKPVIFRETNGLSSSIDNQKLYPLGGISNITTILGNESGYYPVIKTDEHGFCNPKGLYQENGVALVITGDSFSVGYSVKPDESISAVLRKSGLENLNLGKGGNGPLMELAILKEFAETVKPKIVLWLYFTNDLKDLGKELKSEILSNYLNKTDYSQRLILRQDEVDQTLKNFVKTQQQKIKREKSREKIVNNWASRIFKLTNLREKIYLCPKNLPKPRPLPEKNLSIFKNVLAKAKKMVSQWGGKLYFVYLPAFEECTSDRKDENREFVFRTIKELGIPTLDIHKEIFLKHQDPKSLFPFRKNGHYNAEGYRLIAEKIKQKLQTDGVIK